MTAVRVSNFKILIERYFDILQLYPVTKRRVRKIIISLKLTAVNEFSTVRYWTMVVQTVFSN